MCLVDPTSEWKLGPALDVKLLWAWTPKEKTTFFCSFRLLRVLVCAFWV